MYFWIKVRVAVFTKRQTSPVHQTVLFHKTAMATLAYPSRSLHNTPNFISQCTQLYFWIKVLATLASSFRGGLAPA